MKTYLKTIRVPRLVIEHDDTAENPREDANLGFLITKERNAYSPDRNETYERIVAETGDEAETVEDHMERITKAFKEHGETVVYIVPVYKHEHGGVVYRRGSAHGFDYSNCGFYIVTQASKKAGGYERAKKEEYDGIIDTELVDFTHWANGEVYRFTLYDEKGEVEDSCGGFYDMEAIQQNLPDEWKDERMGEYMAS